MAVTSMCTTAVRLNTVNSDGWQIIKEGGLGNTTVNQKGKLR